MDSKFPEITCLLCDEAPVTAAMSRNMNGGTRCRNYVKMLDSKVYFHCIYKICIDVI
jgi:hypothetical protein